MSFNKHINCTKCNKIAIEVSRMKVGNQFMVKLKCGHSMFTKQLETFEAEDDLVSYLTKDKPFEYQLQTLSFIKFAGGRVGIFHEQGLGKTICAALALRTHKKQMLPALAVCKSNIAHQWMKQFINWVDLHGLVQIIESSKDWILPGCQLYVISYDLLRRMSDEQIAKFDVCQTVIIDECQHIKNTQSQRAQNVRRICRDKKYVMALSGTPIKNHAGEYFSILNILKPERFPSQTNYEFKYVDTYYNGFKLTVGGLKNEALFRKNTEDFIIRYEQKEVMPDLPDLIRDFQYHDIDKDLRKAYDKAENELVDFVNTNEDYSGFSAHQHILAYLSKMRQITAVAKVGAVVEDIEEVMTNTNEKMIIFLHHHIARDILLAQLNKLCAANKWAAPLAITEATSRDKAESIKAKFADPNSLDRIIVLGTLASGEGLDGLQESCSMMYMLERQWNPSNEEQPEKRLHRIGQKNIVRAKYPIAIGTVDEMFTELVEKKRQNVKQTMGDAEVIRWDETSTVRDLISAIMTKRGGKRWQMAV